MAWCSTLPCSLVMAGLTCAHWLLNVKQVFSLPQPQSPISLTRARYVCFNQPSSNPSYSIIITLFPCVLADAVPLPLAAFLLFLSLSVFLWPSCFSLQWVLPTAIWETSTNFTIVPFYLPICFSNLVVQTLLLKSIYFNSSSIRSVFFFCYI